MIKAVLLDLDDTILDFHKAEHRALSNTLMQLGVTADEEMLEHYSAVNRRHWELLEEGKITRKQLLVQRFEVFFEEIGLDASAQVAKAIYEKELGTGHFFLPGAKELLEQLRGVYALYLMSNGTARVQRGRIESAGIAPYFQKIFISEKIGYNKPRREFFECCFKEMPPYAKEEMIIIGDSLTSDILGGINAGIHTCWFHPKQEQVRTDILPEYEVKSLAEIPELLSSI